MNIALILAGGIGKRMGSDIPKQFIKINDNPIIFYSLNTFEQIKEIDAIFIVSHKDYIDETKSIVNKYNLSKVKEIVVGGSTRQESVFNGLKAVRNKGYLDDDIILIHDGARPLITKEIILANVESCLKYNACETAIKVSDTIIKSNDSIFLNSLIDRDSLYQVQTPQTFKLNLILKAHEASQQLNATDDAQMVKNYGHNVAIVKGNKLNYKITSQDDLEMLKMLIRSN